MMKNFFLCVLSLLVFKVGTGQITIEQINTEEQALQFVKQENYAKDFAPQWKFFYLTDGTEWTSYYNFSSEKKNALLSKKTNYLRWLKADLNNDGKPDLIVSGYIARRPKDWNTATFKLLIFMSQSGKGYVEYNILTKKSEKYPAYLSVLKGGEGKLLRLSRWQNVSKVVPLQVDTLKFNTPTNSFVNYHAQGVTGKEVQKIVYRAYDDAQGAYHEAILENSEQRNVALHINVKAQNDKVPNAYRAKISKQLWLQIDSLSRSLRILQDSITINSKQLGTQELATKLTLFYTDGTHQSITDFGAEGSYSLMTIYQTMEYVIQNVFVQMQERQQALQIPQSGW